MVYINKQQKAASHADRHACKIDECVTPVFPKVTEGNFEKIMQHVKWCLPKHIKPHAIAYNYLIIRRL